MLQKLFSKTTPETKANHWWQSGTNIRSLDCMGPHSQPISLSHYIVLQYIDRIVSTSPFFTIKSIIENRCLRVLFRIFWFQSPLQVPISTSPLQCSLQHQRNDLVALARPLSDLSENNGWTAGRISRICKVSLEYNTMGDIFYMLLQTFVQICI